VCTVKIGYQPIKNTTPKKPDVFEWNCAGFVSILQQLERKAIPEAGTVCMDNSKVRDYTDASRRR